MALIRSTASAASIPRSQITGVVLAGGLGTRMGGVDKGLQMFNGVPLALRALRRLQPQVGPCCISANRHQEDYARFGVPVLSDNLPGFAGPLAGLLAALQHCQTPYLVSVPCDVPWFPHTLVARLSRALADSDAPAAVAVALEPGPDGVSIGRKQPTFCLVRAELRTSLEQFMAGGERKAGAWLAAHQAVAVHFKSGGRAFVNANTTQQLQALQT